MMYDCKETDDGEKSMGDLCFSDVEAVDVEEAERLGYG